MEGVAYGVQSEVKGRDWTGTWCWTVGAHAEELLVISNLYSEVGAPYSRLSGLSKEVRRRCLKGNKVSLMLVDCCIHKTSIRELRSLTGLYTLSIENVDFVTDEGIAIFTGPIFQSLANYGQVKCLHVDSSLFDLNIWTYEKNIQAAKFLATTPLRSIYLTDIPPLYLPILLSAALSRNTTLISLRCVNTTNDKMNISKEGWEAIICALETNKRSKLASITFIDHTTLSSPDQLCPYQQARLHRLLLRNAHYLTDPYLAVSDVDHNSDEYEVDAQIATQRIKRLRTV